MDLTLKTIIEFRDEMRELGNETRSTLAEHPHRLNVVGATIAGLKADVGVLLTSLPVINERPDNPEARVAALEARG